MRRGLRTAVYIAIDVLLAGAFLCIFALFHHVLPVVVETDRTLSGTSTSASAESAAETGAVQSSGTSDVVSSAQTTEFDLPEGIFTDGEIVTTATSYKSANVSVTLSSAAIDGAVCHIADIYVTSAEYLRSAFVYDTYGRGLRQHPLEMAQNNSAVCAVNGDYYGNSSSNGVVIRNGELYRDAANADVLVMYRDGTMADFGAGEFDAAAEMAKGAWQAWCFGPTLVENGTANAGFSSRVAGLNPRTGIGYYDPGHYVFVTVDGRSDESAGMTLTQFAQFFEQLGCDCAYNLDGGKTSVMTFGDEIVNVPDGGGRTSSDIIYVADGIA